MTDIVTAEDLLAVAVLCAVVNESTEGARDFALEGMARRFLDDPAELGERIMPTGLLEFVRARRADRSWPEMVVHCERLYEMEKRAREAFGAAAESLGARGYSDWRAAAALQVGAAREAL